MAIAVSILFHGVVLVSSSGIRECSPEDSHAFSIQARLALRPVAADTQPFLAAQEAATPGQFAADRAETAAVASASVQEQSGQRSRVDTTISPKKETDSALNTVFQAPGFEQAFVPRYPFLALSKGIRGKVTARFRVGKEGSIEDVTIISSPVSGGFDAAVVQALANTRITPGSARPNSLMMVTVIFDPAGVSLQDPFAQTPEGNVVPPDHPEI